MPIQTVDAPEALLQVISEYQGLNGHRATPDLLWAEIAKFLEVTVDPIFHSYQMSGRLDAQTPNAQFLADLGSLMKHHFIELKGDGRLELTPVGRCLSFGRALPQILQPLADRVVANREK